VFDPDSFAETGKVMDGWESQRGRQRNRGNERCDHVIIALGIAGELVALDVDTSHFMRNAPKSVELHGARLAPGADPSASNVEWVALAPRTLVDPNTHNYVIVEPDARGQRFTHVRLTIHPDGGVARLRAYGRGMAPSGALTAGSNVNLAALELGAVTIAASDEYYGGISNLLLPGPSQRMDEGWETSRTRDRSPDEWVVVRLAAPGRVNHVMVDTAHFKGNAPERIRVDGVLLGALADRVDVADDDLSWHEIVPASEVGPHAEHEFDAARDTPVVDHVRLIVEPDGGVARFRVHGTVAP
jgi:allantoicase